MVYLSLQAGPVPLPTSIQQVCSHLERGNEDLTATGESLSAAKRGKMAAKIRHHRHLAQASLSQERMSMLRANGDKAKEQLKKKEEELKFLKILLHKGEKSNQVLRAVIANLEAEIAELRRKLARVECELSLTKEESWRLKWQLLEARRELVERERDVRDMETIRAELQRERIQFDMLLSSFSIWSQVNSLTSYLMFPLVMAPIVKDCLHKETQQQLPAGTLSLQTHAQLCIV